MPAQRVSMRKIIDVLWLRGTTTLNTRQIAKSTGVGDTTVREFRCPPLIGGSTVARGCCHARRAVRQARCRLCRRLVDPSRA